MPLAGILGPPRRHTPRLPTWRRRRLSHCPLPPYGLGSIGWCPCALFRSKADRARSVEAYCGRKLCMLSGLWKMWSVLLPFVSRSSPSPLCTSVLAWSTSDAKVCHCFSLVPAQHIRWVPAHHGVLADEYAEAAAEGNRPGSAVPDDYRWETSLSHMTRVATEARSRTTTQWIAGRIGDPRREYRPSPGRGLRRRLLR